MSVAIVGAVTIAVILAALLSNRFSPVMVFAPVSFVGALVLGFTPTDISGFMGTGFTQVVGTATLFVFAIIFFGLMTDAGLFDPLVSRLTKIAKDNVVAVAVVTVVLGALVHLDGSGAATAVIVIPPLLPIWQRLRMRVRYLVLLLGAGTGAMNALPWGGATGRAATVAGIDAADLWRPLIPVQIITVVLCILLAVFIGRREQRRIAALSAPEPAEDGGARRAAVSSAEAGSQTASMGVSSATVSVRVTARTNLFWVNLALTLATIAVLITGTLPGQVAFMLAVPVAMVINYPRPSEQNERLRAHAPAAMTMATIMLSAGAFLGIITESGMLQAMIDAMLTVIPDGVGRHLHIIVGLLAVPLGMVFGPDTYYFALQPAIAQISLAHGVDATSVATSMLIGDTVGWSLSPVVPAAYLLTGLAGVKLGEHIRTSFLWIWGLSIVMLLVTIGMGIIAW